MPLLPLKLTVWGLTAVFIGVGYYLLFCCQDPARCGAQPGPGRDAGQPPAKAARELSLEEMA